MIEFIKEDYLDKDGNKIGYVTHIKGATKPIFDSCCLIVKVADIHIRCETLEQARAVIVFSQMGEIVANYEKE